MHTAEGAPRVIDTHVHRMIDTHVHVIAEDEAAYPLRPMSLSGAWYREAPCSAEGLREAMDESGVARAILVQPLGAYSYDNRYTADSALRHPDRFVGVCCVDPMGEDPVGALTHWVRDRGMRGVRLFALSRDDSTWLDDPRTFPLWERAAELDARIVVTILHHQIPRLRAVLERFPELPVSLDHCGFPPLVRDPWPEAAPLMALAAHPKLHLKVSTHVLDAAARGGDPRHFVRALAERFGAQRLMWGSDFCQTHDRSYERLVTLGREAFSALSAEEQAWCLGGTASKLWAWD
jgi:predicted TIM-barrel fold metal-dependent hydrolase